VQSFTLLKWTLPTTFPFLTKISSKISSKTTNFLKVFGKQCYCCLIIKPFNIYPVIISSGDWLVVMERASKCQALAEPSLATLGLSFSSLRLLKIKLFKPENSIKQAFQAWPNFFGKLPFPMLNHHLKHLNS
jgi:hypothetical protein